MAAISVSKCLSWYIILIIMIVLIRLSMEKSFENKEPSYWYYVSLTTSLKIIYTLAYDAEYEEKGMKLGSVGETNRGKWTFWVTQKLHSILHTERLIQFPSSYLHLYRVAFKGIIQHRKNLCPYVITWGFF